MNDYIKLAIIGLGYVGLPLAVEFGGKYKTIGLDLNEQRVADLQNYNDYTKETSKEKLKSAIQNKLIITSNTSDIANCNFYLVTVPTPVDAHMRPILTPLIKASESIGKYLKKGDVVIYESTVYPGVTEDECVPVLEKISGLKFNVDFYCGYSPERINPGDKKNTLTKIVKVTSGSTPEIAIKVDDLYNSILENGTHMAPSIKVAEASKVIENAQRDLNIGFMNELAKIFHELNIDTTDVLQAAGSKWNFLNFTPGLVGGHCIGVDPYYLVQKAQEVGYNPDLILASRRLNDGMGKYVAERVIKLMINEKVLIAETPVLVLGLSFKENCPDIRNTKVTDIITHLKSYGAKVDVCDPWVNKDEALQKYDIELKQENYQRLIDKYKVVVLAVAHNEFVKLDYSKTEIVFDVKSVLERSQVNERL